MNYIVYLLECADGTLYCGITNNLSVRLQRHNDGSASRYTASRLPVKLVCALDGFTRSSALQLESQIKQQSKAHKVEYLLSFQSQAHERQE